MSCIMCLWQPMQLQGALRPALHDHPSLSPCRQSLRCFVFSLLERPPTAH